MLKLSFWNEVFLAFHMSNEDKLLSSAVDHHLSPGLTGATLSSGGPSLYLTYHFVVTVVNAE